MTVLQRSNGFRNTPQCVGAYCRLIQDPDWTACQNIGDAAWFPGFEGVLAPSVTGEGDELGAFESRASAHLALKQSEPLTFAELSRRTDVAT